MSKLCRICGATPLPGARFCRVCGAPLNAVATHQTGDAVSPQAQTIPLASEGRPTDGISPEDQSYSKPDTARVRQEEIDRLMRHSPDGRGGSASIAEAQVPPTISFESAAQPSRPEAATAAPSSNAAAQAPASTTPTRRIWQAAAVILLGIALTAGALAYFFSRRAPSGEAGGASPISLSDQKKLVAEQLTEADSLLAAGDTEGAIAKLRYAVKLDPSSAEAHRRLGLALEKKGERREAINEYRAATENDPANSAAWRALAGAQMSEGLYGEAAETYARIIGAMDERQADDNLRLEYADALRLAGRTEEARALYQKISNSESLDLARRANEQLAQLPPQATNSAGNGANDPRAQAAQNHPPESGSELPSNTQPANTVAVNTQPNPPPTNPAPDPRPAESDRERYYAQALNIVQGRDVKSLQRAELLRALQLFQNVKGGPHADEARKYADRLGKEYDRRRKND
ncbi:MAG: tetratricopeptide repeat protein [Acidobacteria bacterium]|nr:tetratricopeptide repeat protein [Acidobacteriota bacterium]